jgi:hypothetical protein
MGSRFFACCAPVSPAEWSQPRGLRQQKHNDFLQKRLKLRKEKMSGSRLAPVDGRSIAGLQA